MFGAPLCPSSGAREYYTDGRCLWYLVLWFPSSRYGVELRVMCPVCGLQLHILTTMHGQNHFKKRGCLFFTFKEYFEIKFKISMAKAAFNKTNTLFTSKLDLNLRKKLIKCYTWSMAFYGAENWTLRAADQKHLESFEMCCWRRMEKISWTDHVRNEELLLRVNEQRNILHEIKKRKSN